DLEDIAQDIFLKLFRSIERFDPDRGVKFTTWTYTFVRNHCFDVLKKRRVKTTSLTYVDSEEKQRDLVDETTPQPSPTLETRELGRKIEEALSTLGEEQRMVFVLREYEGLGYGAIAQVMDVSEGTIKSRLHRAKEALRTRLAPYLRTGS
ncbi:MAG: sigma-70 family RNA polymerase sigma factor, partial [Planctomycetota bacterium]